MVLMNNGKFDDLTISDVKELFHLLDRDGSGTLEFAEIEMLLQEVTRIVERYFYKVRASMKTIFKGDRHDICYGPRRFLDRTEISENVSKSRFLSTMIWHRPINSVVLLAQFLENCAGEQNCFAWSGFGRRSFV